MANLETIDEVSILAQKLLLFIEQTFNDAYPAKTAISDSGNAKKIEIFAENKVFTIYISSNGIRLHLPLSTYKTSILLRNLLIKFSNNEQPNFSYYVRLKEDSYEDYKQRPEFIYEWSHPGYEWLNYAKIISNSRFGTSYLCYDVKCLRESVPKIKGIYPSKVLKTEKITNAIEDELFWIIFLLNERLFSTTAENFSIQEEIVFAQEYCINQLRKYGLSLPNPDYNIFPSSSFQYKKWYDKMNEKYFSPSTDINELEDVLQAVNDRNNADCDQDFNR